MRKTYGKKPNGVILLLLLLVFKTGRLVDTEEQFESTKKGIFWWDVVHASDRQTEEVPTFSCVPERIYSYGLLDSVDKKIAAAGNDHR